MIFPNICKLQPPSGVFSKRCAEQHLQLSNSLQVDGGPLSHVLKDKLPSLHESCSLPDIEEEKADVSGRSGVQLLGILCPGLTAVAPGTSGNEIAPDRSSRPHPSQCAPSGSKAWGLNVLAQHNLTQSPSPTAPQTPASTLTWPEGQGSSKLDGSSPQPCSSHSPRHSEGPSTPTHSPHPPSSPVPPSARPSQRRSSSIGSGRADPMFASGDSSTVAAVPAAAGAGVAATVDTSAMQPALTAATLPTSNSGPSS